MSRWLCLCCGSWVADEGENCPNLHRLPHLRSTAIRVAEYLVERGVEDPVPSDVREALYALEDGRA